MAQLPAATRLPAPAKILHLNPHRRPSTASKVANEEKLARIILSGIEAELSSADFFTREDLLQLRVLQSVATITRYKMVCEAIHWLANSRRLTMLSRTEICLTGYTSGARKVSGPNLLSQYGPTVQRLVTKWSAESRGAFDLVDLLSRWTTDPHLSTNAKRVCIRQTLKRLRAEGSLRPGPTLMSFLAQGD